jgi:dTDP-4-amino-4,6-dideoxygalactose transaminase
MSIRQVDLAAQFQSIKPEIMAAIEEVLDSAQLFLGPQTQAFEAEFAAYCGVRFAIGVANGTDALHLALRAAGIGPGDEVVTVSHTFIAVVEAIEQVGARAVLVDIDPVTMNMDPRLLKAALTPRTRAVVPVHLYGRLADMDQIVDIAHAHGAIVVEDASQAQGAVDASGRKAGSFGDLATFSFYYAKNLGAYGEAGAITTNNPGYDEQLRLLRTHGESVRYQHRVLGFNSRLDEIQAAVLRVKLRHLDRWNQQRIDHAVRYDELLSDLPIQRPELITTGAHVYHQYAIRVRDRDQVRAALETAGIGTGIHYPVPIHLQPACEHLEYGEGALPVTEATAREELSLPMYPELRDEQVQEIAESLRSACLASSTRSPH